MPKLSAKQQAAAQEQGFDKGDGGDLKPLPSVGPYVYKLIDCEEKPSKKGNLQWVWTLTLSKLHHPELVGKGYLERLWSYTSVEPGEEWRVGKMLNQFGYTEDTETDELINDGATILAYVYDEEFNGKPTMKARRFAQHDEEEYPPVDSDDDEY